MRFVIAVLRPFARWWCRVLFKIEFHGVENIPAEGACLITPNHITYADPIWITIPDPQADLLHGMGQAVRDTRPRLHHAVVRRFPCEP